MALTMMMLDQDYRALRDQFIATGHRQIAPGTLFERERATEIAHAICDDCNDHLTHQLWSKPGISQALAVCMVCYKATRI